MVLNKYVCDEKKKRCILSATHIFDYESFHAIKHFRLCLILSHICLASVAEIYIVKTSQTKNVVNVIKYTFNDTALLTLYFSCHLYIHKNVRSYNVIAFFEIFVDIIFSLKTSYIFSSLNSLDFSKNIF